MMLATVIILVLIVQAIQLGGDTMARRLDKR